MQRAADRQRDLRKKRSQVAEARAKKRAGSSTPDAVMAAEEERWPVPQPAKTRPKVKKERQQSVKPHRMARAAARQNLAKGAVMNAADMPTFSRGAGGNPRHSKPSVSSPLLVLSDEADIHNFGASDFELDETTTTEDEWGPQMHDSDSTNQDDETTPVGSTAVTGYEEEMPDEIDDSVTPHSLPGKIASLTDSISEAGEAMSAEMDDGVVASTIRCNDVARFASKYNPNIPQDAQNQNLKHEDCGKQVAEQSLPNSANTSPSSCESNSERREEILRNLVEHLKQQESESSRRAEEAAGRLAAVGARKDEVRRSKSHGVKLGLQLEKRLAAEMKKKRNQDLHLQTTRERADRAIKEACALKEQAEAEALAAKATCLAQAEQEARQVAEAYFIEEVAKAKAQSEALIQNGLKEVATAEAAMRAEAQTDAAASKQDALQKAQALEAQAQATLKQAEAEAQKLVKRATIEANVIKARADMHVKECISQAEVQQLAKQQAEREACWQAQAEAEAVARVAEAEKQRQTAAYLKLGKARQQKQAKETRRRAELDKRREREEAARRVRIGEEQKPAAEEVEALTARAKEDAQTLEAKLREQAEAAGRAAREKAEKEAREIVAKAEEEARVFREKLQAERAHACAEIEAKQALLAAETSEPSVDDSWELILAPSDTEEASQEAGWSLICA